MIQYKLIFNTIKKYKKTVSTLITLLLVPLFVYLGLWQWGRMEFKTQLIKQLEENSIANPILFTDLLSFTHFSEMNSTQENLRFKRIEISGQFFNDKQLLLDNQIFEKKVGYHLITPLLVQHKLIVLIDRGFIPIEESRSHLPTIKPIIGEIKMSGIITKADKPILLNNNFDKTHPTYPLIIQLVDFKELSTLLELPIFPWLVKLSPESSYAYKVGPPNFGLSPKRHLGYALQWFTMAITVIIYFLVINSRRSNDKQSN